MKYRAFGDFRRGYAHVKNGSGVEDFAGAYNDPAGRFYIGVICDGHSDKNCFRSSKGSQFGCESAIEVLTRFFELYLSQSGENRILPEGYENRLKRSIKLCWDCKVQNDIMENPISDEDLEQLEEQVRKIYMAKKGLLNIYGATFLAIGLCEDFFIALHIGDGAILCVDEEGTYYSPVAQDPKSETGAPASLCDTDLFTRENAFRISLTRELPQLATVSSDGIEDCMDSFEYKEFTSRFFQTLENKEEQGQNITELNEVQRKYLGNCLEYYADHGNGAEDDCSLAAIYDTSRLTPDVRIPQEEAIKLWEATMAERNQLVKDYERRKNNLINNIQSVQSLSKYKKNSKFLFSQFIEDRVKLKEQKETLKNIETNEKNKVAYYDNKLKFYEKFIVSSSLTGKKLLEPEFITMLTDDMTNEDSQFESFYELYKEYESKKSKIGSLLEDKKIKDDFFKETQSYNKTLIKNGQKDDADRLFAKAKENLEKAEEAYVIAKLEFDEVEQRYINMRGEYLSNINVRIIDSSNKKKDIFGFKKNIDSITSEKKLEKQTLSIEDSGKGMIDVSSSVSLQDEAVDIKNFDDSKETGAITTVKTTGKVRTVNNITFPVFTKNRFLNFFEEEDELYDKKNITLNIQLNDDSDELDIPNFKKKKK